MKIYLAGSGIDNQILYKTSKKNKKKFNRLVSFIYKKDIIDLIKLKKREKKREKK